jgi:hypothetical protein
MKYYKSIIDIGFLLIFLSLVISCSSSVEIKEQFKVETSFRPDMDSRANYTDKMNELFIDQAKKAGKDSVIQFQSSGNRKLSPYKDVAFLTVSGAEELTNLCSDYGSVRTDFSTQISHIDFNKYFVFIVAHPVGPVMTGTEINSSQALYFDKVFDIATEDSIRKIKLETSRLGSVSEELASFAQKWQSHIYIIPRNGCEDVLLELDKEKYTLYLNK